MERETEGETEQVERDREREIEIERDIQIQKDREREREIQTYFVWTFIILTDRKVAVQYAQLEFLYFLFLIIHPFPIIKYHNYQ